MQVPLGYGRDEVSMAWATSTRAKLTRRGIKANTPEGQLWHKTFIRHEVSVCDCGSVCACLCHVTSVSNTN